MEAAGVFVFFSTAGKSADLAGAGFKFDSNCARRASPSNF
jgi:hypothetical protein